MAYHEVLVPYAESQRNLTSGCSWNWNPKGPINLRCDTRHAMSRVSERKKNKVSLLGPNLSQTTRVPEQTTKAAIHEEFVCQAGHHSVGCSIAKRQCRSASGMREPQNHEAGPNRPPALECCNHSESYDSLPFAQQT